MAFRYEECSTCWHHFHEPAVCDNCIDADEYFPDGEQDRKRASSWSPATRAAYATHIAIIPVRAIATVTADSKASLPSPVLIKAEPK
jgi:hypothetical protein